MSYHYQDNLDPPSPSDKTALILHRQGFTSCYTPWGMRGNTNGGKVNIKEHIIGHFYQPPRYTR